MPSAQYLAWYQAMVAAQNQQLVSAEKFFDGGKDLRQFQQELPEDYQQFVQQMRGACQRRRVPKIGQQTLKKHDLKQLVRVLRLYERLATIPPSERDTWTCTPSAYEGLIRLNKIARQVYQQRLHDKRAAEQPKSIQLSLALEWGRASGKEI